METRKFDIIGSRSNIDWTGRKVTGAHNGTIPVKEGQLIFNGAQLTGGRFVIDTTAITILDVADPATNAQFAGHLASDDFFSSAQYPEALLEITSASGSGNHYHIDGELTIKGITHPIAFDAQVTRNSDQLTATADMKVDRTRYGMRFRSGNFFRNLGDTLIYNDFDLHISITAKAVTTTVQA